MAGEAETGKRVEDPDAAVPQGVLDNAGAVGSEVALARRQSPSSGDRFVGLARALVHEMPHTMAALTAEVCGERHAVAVVAATACLRWRTGGGARPPTGWRT